MNRRQFLRTVGVAGLAAGGSLAGCVGGDLGAGPTTDGTPVNPTTDELAVSPTAGDWPTFGADRANTGHAPEAVGPTDNAEVIWKFDARSPTANTSPVVVGETVFTGSSGTGGNLYALDAATGELRWEFDVPGWVNHAPAVRNGTVYVGTDGQTFHAVEAATGEEQWKVDLGRDLHDSSPTVVDGTLFVGTAGNSPAVASDGSEVDRSAALVALDAATGEERWSYEVADWISTAPAVVGGRVYFGDNTGRVRALDAETGEEAWSARVADHHVLSSPTVVEGTLFVGAGGRLHALDAPTGDAHWTFDLRWPTVKSSPAVADGTVYVGCHGSGGCPLDGDGDTCDPPEHTARLYALDADHGAEQWAYPIESDVRSSPAVADGVVYLGCAGGVSAVSAADGSEAWRVDFGEYVDSSPAVSGGRAFVNCSDGNVYALG